MKGLVYLILAHEQPTQVARLVAALDSPLAAFHIHIDAKVPLAPFEAALPASDRVHYVRDRVKVEWMGWSIVEATLRMARDALRHDFSYALLLSGADYPVKPRAEIEEFYQSASKEFIAFWRLEDRPEWLAKVRHFYPIDQVPIRGWSTGTEPSWWRRFFWGRWTRWSRRLPDRRFPAGLTPYGGPDWWSLSRACLAHVVDEVQRRPALPRFYRFTASPGEMFFQTLVLNSPFGQCVHQQAAYERWREASMRALRLSEDSFNYRYVDWSGEAGGEREAPAVLDDRDWPALRDTHCHFARKFDAIRSASLLTRIDAELLAAKECPHAVR